MIKNCISKSKINNSNKGFTLVELIVVLTMMAIVLTLGGFAILKWQDWATFNQENEYAQTLFVAAQNQLAEYSASGRLEVLQMDLKSDGKYGQAVNGDNIKGIVLDVTSLTSESGEAYDKASIWSEAYRIDPTGGDNASKYIDDIVALRAEAGEYSQYISDPAAFKTSNPQAYWVYELLGSYVYDTSILDDAAICIEFTPDDGQVFSVFYSDKNHSFIYSNHDNVAANNGAADIINRQETYRYEHMIGFYGVEKLTKSTRDKNQMANIEVKNVVLHNENTLNLTFDVDDKSFGELDYAVSLVTGSNPADKDVAGAFTSKFEIVVPGDKIKNTINAVECKVNAVNADGTKTDMGTMSFPVMSQASTVNEDCAEVILVLDAADIHAGENVYRDYKESSAEKHSDDFENTYSIFRLINTVSMNYLECMVVASGTGYIDSEEAWSINIEHMCAKTVNGNEYTLTNARHLYNVRYLEVENAGANTYILSNCDDIYSKDSDGDNTIDWKLFAAGFDKDGKSLSYNKLYDSGKNNQAWSIEALNVTSLGDCDYPSIVAFGAGNEIKGNDGSQYVLKNFSINGSSNTFYQYSHSYRDAKGKSAGFIIENNGTVSNILFDSGVVCASADCTAVVAAKNYGTIKDVKINNVSVKGKNMVGGYAGYNNGEIIVSEGKAATSFAPKVTGDAYVGGIVGYNAADGTIVNHIVNKGTVEGEGVSYYVGGFVGLNESIALLQDSNNKAITIKSNPDKVSGEYFVGGCLGGNIINTNGYSNLTAGGGTTPGGGSTPTNPASGDILVHTNSVKFSNWGNNKYAFSVTFENVTEKNINQWYVDCSELKSLGASEAGISDGRFISDGMIVRVNPNNNEYTNKELLRGGKGTYTVYLIINNPNDVQKIEEAVNNGAIKSYVDSYFSYNTVTNTSNTFAMIGSNIRFAAGAPETKDIWAEVKMVDFNGYSYARYTITVHNDSNITAGDWKVQFKIGTEIASSDCWMNGWINKSIENDIVTFSATPGMTSINAGGSVVITMNVYFKDNQSRDYAQGFVQYISGDVIVGNKIEDSFNGGISGGSTPSNPSVDEVNVINASFANSNTAGELSGKAFVGGYIGYNMLIDSTDANAVYDLVQSKYIQAVKGAESLADKYKAVDSLAISGIGSGVNKSEVEMWINKDATNVKNNAGVVSADICVGGILGYSQDETKVTIFNTTNYSRVIANSYIVNDDEQINEDNTPRITDYEGKSKTYQYSYAGSIVGTNNKLSVIDNCANKASYSVVSQGTYTGSLCEVNDGTITNCLVDTFGSATKEYVGGLCGLNKNVITKCNFSNYTVSGKNVVGGLTAENFGEISDITLNKAKMNVSGMSVVNINGDNDVHGVVGLYAGFNGYSGVIDLEKDVIGSSVESSGRYVGFVVGYNSGKLVNKKTASNNLAKITDNLNFSGTIKGYQTVGALCGYNNSIYDINNYTNITSVNSMNGEAGGIVGFNDASNTIKYCVNNAIVIASDNGNAGGITSVNDGIIENCYDYITVTAPNGLCAGITSINNSNGEIRACYVGPQGDSNSTITFTSTTVAGGVAAKNAGLIENNNLKNLIITNNTLTLGTRLGVISGENLSTGTIILDVNPSIVNCKVVAEANDARMGGVAGLNEGSIIGQVNNGKPNSYVKSNLVLGKASYATMGGVAGVNTGLIKNVSVDSSIKGYLASTASGYGGIAGLSGYTSKSTYSLASNSSGKSYPALIENCTFDGTINASGTSGSIASIGGIVGYNGYGSEIKSCYIGVLGSDKNSENITYITAGDTTKTNDPNNTDIISYAYIGGIAGRNYGKITEIDMEGYGLNDNISIIAFAGATGGVVGYNYAGAIVSGTDATHKITTSSNMVIDMRRGENDRGPGGIIGVNESGNNISFVDNYAFVKGLYKSNMKTGGFIGTNMQQEVYQLSIKNCNNYGEVTGYGNTGGFIGLSWYRGIIFDTCNNYGFIYVMEGSVSDQKFASGFIGRIHTATAPYYFNNCQNHGNILTHGTNGKAGGFVAEIETGSCTGDFYNCVNTGIISKRDGDITYLGNFIGGGGSNWNYNLCRNYNTSRVQNGFGPKGKCTDCLDVSLQIDDTNMYTPYADGNSNNNYYVSKDDESVSDFDTNSYGAYFSVHNGQSYINSKGETKYKAWNIKRGSSAVGYTSYKNYELLFEEPSKYANIYADNTEGEQMLNFRLASDESYNGMKSFSVYFRTPEDSLYSTTEYKYDYTIKFLDASGSQIGSDTTGTIYVSGSFDIDRYKVTATVPSGRERDIKNIIVLAKAIKQDGKSTPANVHLLGFSWVPFGGSKETTLTGLSNMNGIASKFDYSNSASVIGSQSYDYSYLSLKGTLLDTEYYSQNGVMYKVNAGTTTSGAVVVGKEQKFTITNTYSGETGLGTIYYYVSNDISSPASIYNYEYKYTLTDINGVKYERKTYIPYDCNNENGKIELKIADIITESNSDSSSSNNLTSNKITTIEFKIRNKNITTGGTTNDPSGYIFFKGVSYVPSNSTRETHFAYADLGASNNYPLISNMSVRTGASSIYPLYADDKTKAAPFLHTDWDDTLGIQMSSNNPLFNQYEQDKNQIKVDKKSQNGNGYVKWVYNMDGSIEADVASDVPNSRISVYKDIDPKFLTMAIGSKATNTQLQTPANTSLNLDKGNIVYKWDKVSKDINNKVATPYGYEVEYTVYNAERIFETGTTVQPYTNVNSTSWAFPVNIQDEWIENKCFIKVKVRAINAYRYANGGSDAFDSAYSEEKITSLDIPLLAQPKAHIEVTADNNMVAVLDNPEDFEDIISIAAGGSIVTDKMSELCNIVVDWEGYGTFTIDPSNGNIFSKESINVANGSYKLLTAYAVPKDEYDGALQTSASYNQKGNFEANGVLTSRDRYNATTIDFNGFTGDGSSTLRYNINIKNGDDSFVTGDFGAYNSELGLYIYYDRATAHLGASAGGGNGVYNSMVLSNIPVDIFGVNKTDDMEARVYLESSQNEIVHYGHKVCEGVILDSDDKDANYAVLASIKDKYHLTTNGSSSVVDLNFDVWDSANNMLKSGYSLYLEEDGTYSIYYNATIELAMNNAANVSAKNGVNKKYSKYAVDVMRYDSFDLYSDSNRYFEKNTSTVYANNTKLELDYLQDGYYIRRQSIDDGAFSAFNIRKFSKDKNTNVASGDAYKYYIDIAPAPMVEPDTDGNEVTKTTNANGQKVYSVMWDTYYKDIYAWNNGTYYAKDDTSYLSYAGCEVKDGNDNDITLPTTDTWERFKTDTAFYNNFINDTSIYGNRQWCRYAMNCYYFSYEGAKYKVYLMGKTATGEYVELASQTVSTPNTIDTASVNYKIDGSMVSNSYEFKAYATSFTDTENEWSGYSDITIRIVRLGGEQYGKGIVFPGKSDQSNGIDALFVLPRYSEVAYEQKQPLSTLSAPDVAITGSVASANSLKYDVKFDLITNSDMIKDVGGYVIEVKDTDTNPATAVETTYYIVKEDGKSLSNYGIDITASVKNAIKFVKDSGTGTATIDLYKFSDKTVEVSVRPLARDNDASNATKYKHGSYSDGKEALILKALPVPDIEKFTVDAIADVVNPEKIVDYKLQYSDTESLYYSYYKDDDAVSIDIQASIEIFKDKSDGSSIGVIYGKDNPLNITRLANSGTVSSVNLVSETITEDVLFQQYAGYWMRIAIVAHSDNYIDSNWSEDLESGDKKYIWVQIPKYKFNDSTKLEKGTVGDLKTKQVEVNIGGTAYDLEYACQSLKIVVDPNVDKYELVLTKGDNAIYANVPDAICLVRKTDESGETWYVYSRTLDVNTAEHKIDNETVIDGLYNKFKPKNLNSDEGDEIIVNASIIYVPSDGNGSDAYFELMIPDIVHYEVTNKSDPSDTYEDNITTNNNLICLKQLKVIPGLSEGAQKQKEIVNQVSDIVWKREDSMPAGIAHYSLDDAPAGGDPAGDTPAGDDSQPDDTP